MYIKNLSLNNYRNYKSEKFEFSKGINILIGDNAQGKTNSAEAIFYLCTGYSPRVTRDKQVIKYGEQSATILGEAVSNYGSVNVKIDFLPNCKQISVNGVPIKKIGELMGNINSVFFNPDDLKLIKDSPEDRRRFMDISLSQMSRRYFYALQKYRKILEQRNELLKNPDKDVIFETIPLWDDQLCSYAEIIINERKDFAQMLAPKAREAYEYITNGSESLDVLSDVSYLNEELGAKQSLINALSERLEKDIVLGYTGVGPHRDDLKIKVDGEDVRVYGSQGQQRTAALSLKLAELEIFKEKFKEYPVLILDDALSELDGKRRSRLIEKLKGVQTIITCTEYTDELPKGQEVKLFKINNGKIEKE